MQTLRTVENHRRRYGIDPDSLVLPPTSADDPMYGQDNLPMASHASLSEPLSRTLRHADLPPEPQSRSTSPLGSDRMSISRAFSLAGSQSASCSGSRPPSPLPQYLQYAGSSSSDSPRHSSIPDLSSDPCLRVMDASVDIELFGRELANLSIWGGFKPSCPSLYNGDPSPEEKDWSDNDNSDDGGSGNPDDPDDPDVQLNDPQIQVPPDDAGGAPRDPGGDDARWDIPALEENPTLRNIYLRVWALYAFHGATQEVIQAMLESHKFALLAGVALYPREFIAEVNNMPTTLRSLERRLGMDFSELIIIYPLCPECGKRYTMEELYALRNPQCLRHVGDQCSGILYMERTLADDTRKRTPTKSLCYNSFPDALGRLLSRIGIANLMQHWRRNPNDAPLENPPEPRGSQEWYDRMNEHTRFGDITGAWGWHAEATGLRRWFDGEEYIDEPTGDAPLSLARLPFGISLGVGADGQVFKGKFAAAGSYSANGIYIVINNLPFYQRNLTENIILALVLPGPREPKGYAFDQMVEPLVNDLIKLARGMELPVYDLETGQIQMQRVYANLSVLIVDWIARIKCTGHVGVTAEENHCPYCKIRQCELATPQGYQSNAYELRDPIQHLQDKHLGLRAPEGERDAIRLETGTSWTEFDRVPGFYAFNNAPIDAMHLLDLGVTASIARTIIYNCGMLRKRFRGQAGEDIPEAQFNSFLARTIFPHHCSRIPTQASTMDRRTKAEQWRLLRLVMPVAYFEAWRDGDAIPDDDIPRGGRNTLHFKAQERSARQLLRRRRNVHHMDDDDPDELPQLEDCASSRNPREYYANILRFCVGSSLLTRHQVTLAGIQQGADLIEQVGIVFTEMNVHLTPSFHAATHLPDHIRKYGNIYNTLTARFERVNRLLANVNTNGHGHGVLEATMVKGFLRRTECYRYVSELQFIEEPTDNDVRTTECLLGAMRNGPEHEVQRGMLDAVLAGEVPMHGQDEIRLATTPAQVNFRDGKHREYYQLMVNFCNHHRPEALRDVVFYGFGGAPDEGGVQVHIRSKGSTLSYPHFHRYGIRYGSAKHYWGLKSRYGYIHRRVPVLIQGIYETTVEVWGQEHKFLAIMVQRFIPPDEEPAFPWNHWNETLGIDAWLYGQLTPVESVPPTVFTGSFVLSDITMPYGHFWITIAMINTTPEDLAEDEELEDMEEVED